MKHGNRKIKWLIYTVLVGLIPILSRLMAWTVTKADIVDSVSPSDFVAFGLVLHISIINEIEHFTNVEQHWKTVQNGMSIAFIAFYSALSSLIFIGEYVVNAAAVTAAVMSMSIGSLMISYSVYDKVSKLERTASGVST